MTLIRSPLLAKGQPVGYARVSSVNQNMTRQLDGLTLNEVFTDKGDGNDTARPALAALLEYLHNGDTLYVDSMDRLGRDLAELYGLLAGDLRLLPGHQQVNASDAGRSGRVRAR